MIVELPGVAQTPTLDLVYTNLTAPVAQRITYLRKRSRVSQHELAIRLDSTDTFVSKLEAGGPAITPQRVRRLARALRVREELFYPNARPDAFWSHVDATLAHYV
jgi:transcriptional regulator with XRE-family HTH domain